MYLRFLHPEIFQGDLKKKDYFEGWYFKHVSHDLQNVWSFIPGISLNSDDPHSFIQIINGITGETHYITYRVDQFSWDRKRLWLKIGESVFTENYVNLNISQNNLELKGHVGYSNNVKYPSTLKSPGIMGWYSFVPYMECKHGIVSVNHDLLGKIVLNGTNIELDGGKGYIEKDWGTSFPEAWIWIQSNNFLNSKTSFTFSLAKIPWLGRFFMGFICFLYLDGRFILFSTHNKSVISETVHDSRSISITMHNRDAVLKITAVKNRFGELRAPASGRMSRRIKESIDSTIDLKLYDNHGKLIYSDTGRRAGLEIIEAIFGYM